MTSQLRAGYPKIWTTILSERWFVSWTCETRGAYLQLLILAKLNGDTGTFTVPNMTTLTALLGLKRRNGAGLVVKFAHESRTLVSKNEDGTVTVTIPNYLKWQGIEPGRRIGENCQKMHINKQTNKQTNNTHEPSDDGSESQSDLQILGKMQKSRKTPKHEILDFDAKAVIDSFNQIATNLPRCRDVTETRRRAIGSALKRNPDLSWPDYWTRVQSSDFLAGRKTEWKANFDWLLKPANMTKVLEGNYDNKNAGTSRPKSAIESQAQVAYEEFLTKCREDGVPMDQNNFFEWMESSNVPKTIIDHFRGMWGINANS